jgi:hypothetical protein
MWLVSIQGNPAISPHLNIINLDKKKRKLGHLPLDLL